MALSLQRMVQALDCGRAMPCAVGIVGMGVSEIRGYLFWVKGLGFRV